MAWKQVPAKLRQCLTNRMAAKISSRKRASGAKAHSILLALSARLKSCPFAHLRHSGIFSAARKARSYRDARSSDSPNADYSAASASACPGNSPAYLVMPTMVKTLVKCGDSPNAYTFWPALVASIRSWMTRAMPLELM